jgi:putative membrane protein insertion efficiency factor
VTRRFLRPSFVLAALGFVLVAALVADLRREPARQLSTRAALAAVHTYQRVLSSWMPAFGIRCRFTPTCSRYAEVVIANDGILRGGWKTARRLARCGPWTPAGTVDPP